MNRFITRALLGTLVAGGITLFGATVANAAETDGEDGLLSGTQALVGVDIPVDVSGIALSVLGDSTSVTPAAPAPAPAPAPASPAPATTSGADGTASGTQAVVDVSAPVTVSGVAVSGVGDATTANAPAPAAPAPGSAPAASATTDGRDGVASGTQALVDLDVPVTVSGLSLAVLGDSTSVGSAEPAATTPTAPAAGGTAPSTSGEDGILGGTQIVPEVAAPVTVTGNAISVLGDSTTVGTAPAGTGTGTASNGGTGPVTDGQDGIGSGTQVAPEVTAPVTATGNAVSVLGDSTTVGTAPTGAGTGGTTGGGTAPATSGDDAVLGGTQIAPVVDLPITVGGNAVSVVGDSTTVTEPATPTEPVIPTEPVDPTDPVDPTEPVDGDSTEVSSSGLTNGTAMPAALDATLLAETGGASSLGVLVMGFLLVALGGGVLAARARRA